MSHFYMTNGQPYHFIAKKDGSGMRPTTVADARRLGLLPGVTTVLKILHKEALVRWMVRQGAMAVLTSPRKDGEDLDSFMERVLATEPDEESQMARDLGGRIHDALEAYVSGKAGIPDDLKVFMEPALAKLHEFGDVIESEKVLVGDGYAGRTDLITLGACACLIDWKTAKTIPDEGKPAWPEHRLQLAAYAAAYRKPCTTANIYVSTAKPGLVRICRHEPWQDTYERGFLPLLKHWQWANNISAGAEQASHPTPKSPKEPDPAPASSQPWYPVVVTLPRKGMKRDAMTFEWLKADTIRLLPQWHSDAMNIKPILIVLEERGYPVVGWYFGGLLNEFRMDGSPSKQFPTHWAPMPPKP